MFTISEHTETLLWIFFIKRQQKIGNTISAHSKSTVLIFRTFKQKYSSGDTVPLTEAKWSRNMTCIVSIEDPEGDGG
jgi:hypothetical protein